MRRTLSVKHIVVKEEMTQKKRAADLLDAYTHVLYSKGRGQYA